MSHIIAYITNNGSNQATLNRILNIMWQIWKARNDLKFQGLVKEPTQVCFAAEAMVRTYTIYSAYNILQDELQE